jgi:hypothetical protein
MFDHDQRFKLLIHEFFGEFLELFFPVQAARFDFSGIQWLDKEVFADPPKGERGYLDLVAQLPTRHPVSGQRTNEPDSLLALVHVEIEQADSVQPLRSRMFQYYEQLRRRYGLPVLPIAIYLRVGLDGIGHDIYEEHFWELRTLTFEYLYVGLPALNAEEYASRDNLLGVALSSLMRAPSNQKAQLAALALKRVVKSKENDWRKFLVGDCVVAYAETDEALKQELEKLLEQEEYREVRTLKTTWYDEGRAVGREEGREEGRKGALIELIASLLEERLGSLSDEVRDRLTTWPTDRLSSLAKAVARGESLQELGLEP